MNLKNVDPKNIRRWGLPGALALVGSAATYVPPIRAALTKVVAEATSYPVLLAVTILMITVIISMAMIILRLVDAGIFLEVLQRFWPSRPEPPPRRTKEARNKKTTKP